MLKICAEKFSICIDGICIFLRRVMHVLFRNNSKVLLHFRNVFTLLSLPMCKCRYGCFCCRTIFKVWWIRGFPSFFLSLSKLDFYDSKRNHAWRWRALLVDGWSEDCIGKTCCLKTGPFIFAVCWVTHMLECLRIKLSKSIPSPHSIRDRISAVHYYLNRYGIIHYSSSQTEKKYSIS